jgi:hypothetical protein
VGLFDKVWHLPLNWFGLHDIPAVPIKFSGLICTIFRLIKRSKETVPARHGLTNLYTINGQTATGEQFLYGPQKLTALSLERPEQFAMSWTNYQGIFARYAYLIPDYAATLTDAEHATQLFWPLIAGNGYGYNLLMLNKAGAADLARMRGLFSAVWSADWDKLAERGGLFFIDLSIFASAAPGTLSGFTRFTPATVTLLEQDPTTKALTPFAVRVSGQNDAAAQNDAGAEHFVKKPATPSATPSTTPFATPSAWLYALQAAKTSVTVYGIWLGHVYHWHLVTAAMQMAMFNTLKRHHPVYKLVAPQSHYLFQFDEFLLLVWNAIAPPTSYTTRCGILDLWNRFAKDRDYFADDPTTALQAQGIVAADFTTEGGKPWDLYPNAQGLLQLWSDTERYVSDVVTYTYASDAAVAEDRHLQAWMRHASHRHGGNIRGLPKKLDSRDALTKVLTSLIYRITAHGVSRMMRTAYPAQLFVANFPPCLQIAGIPSPQSELTTGQLLACLPKTGTIASLLNFGMFFVFSAPYKPFIPEKGVDCDLFFPDGLNDPRNKALVAYRKALIAFMESYAPGEPVGQWPRNIET